MRPQTIELVASWRRCLDSDCETTQDGVDMHFHLVVGPDEGDEVREVDEDDCAA